MKFGIILFSLFLFYLTDADASAKSFTIGTLLKPELKDPADLHYLEDWELAQAVHETLFEYQDGEGLIPALAKKWDVDESSIEIEIFADRLFSDSSPIKAEDVAFSLLRTQNLDSGRATAISQCSNSKSAITFDNNSNKIFLKNYTCPKRILRDMAEVNYAILKKRNNFEKNSFSEYSGLFVPEKIDKQAVIFRPNKFSFRFPKNESEDFRLKIQYIEKPLNKDLYKTVDFIRLDEDLKDSSFKFSKFSIPVAVWYLTLGNSTKGINTNDLVRWLRDKWRNKVVNLERTEEKVDFLFTNDFGCKYKPQKFDKKTENKKMTYSIVSHPSQETKGIEKIFGEILESTKLVKAKEDEVSNIKFTVNRQFLSADANIVLETALKKLSKFSGDAKNVKQKLEKLQKNDEKISTPTLCKLSLDLEIIPLISKKYLFVYNDESLKNIFLPSSGNIVFNRIFNDSRK